MSSEAGTMTASADPSSADRFADQLDALLATHWPLGRGRIVGPSGGPGGQNLQTLLADRDVDRLLMRFHAAQGSQDLRATASVWSQWYLATTWPVLIGATLLFDELPPLGVDAVALVTDAEGCPAGLEVRGPTRRAPVEHRLDELVFAQAAPLLEAVMRASRLPKGVPWSNAATVLNWTLEQLADKLPPAQLAPVRALFDTRDGLNGGPNPLAVAMRETPQGQVRSSCCLRYKLSGFPYCGNCPIPAERRDSRFMPDDTTT
ncbi:siderophore-iron reductase FhuF [Rhodovibrio salinarum]|uniref:Siderophore-iron reductase FhuF n=1 Tax=Rhodovibrio salinarum TaxID=1087 RepID=A0A934V2C4_9PROT|nr:siderophore-iron reductase FhuF [Rhodovibrio salinarum]MBK1699026.1 siderophore-iron reductase FhuF [Rhodovibrio salinarum]